MKKTFASLLMLTCLSAAAFMAVPAQAQTVNSATAAAADATASSLKAEMDAAVAKAGTTSTPTTLQSGIPPGMGGLQGPQSLLPAAKPEPVVKMTYDKSKMEGPFYGAQMPERLFNNVPSEWTRKP